MSNVEVSVVLLLPTTREATIEGTVEVTLSTLASFLPAGTFEVIVAEDGCDDRTPEIATRLAERTSGCATSTPTSDSVAAGHWSTPSTVQRGRPWRTSTRTWRRT